jgi:hypothetical protein
LALPAVGRAVAELGEAAWRARAAAVDVGFTFVWQLIFAVWRLRGGGVDELEFRCAAGSHE